MLVGNEARVLGHVQRLVAARGGDRRMPLDAGRAGLRY